MVEVTEEPPPEPEEEEPEVPVDPVEIVVRVKADG